MYATEICDLSKELFIVGEGKIKVIYKWDEQWIGQLITQTNSELYQVLYTIMNYDKIFPGYSKTTLTPIPYGSHKIQ